MQVSVLAANHRRSYWTLENEKRQQTLESKTDGETDRPRGGQRDRKIEGGSNESWRCPHVSALQVTRTEMINI